MVTTWKYRIKDSGQTKRQLGKMARSVNLVWNYCKQTQRTALKRTDCRIITDKKTNKKIAIPNFFTKYELNNLVSGSSRELGLHSQTVQNICEEYVTRRKQFKKLLRWRGKRTLGWIPFKRVGIKFKKDGVLYCKRKFRIWNSRELPEDAKIKTGSFTEDSTGKWYLNITFESASLEASEKAKSQAKKEIGVDLGVKNLAMLSDGTQVKGPQLREDLVKKLRKIEIQRKAARRRQSKNRRYKKLTKQRQLKKLHARVANQRRNYLHQWSTKIARVAKLIVIGTLPCALMNRSRTLSGKSLDNGIGMFRQMLRYKAERAGVAYVEVSERDSTQTCSQCEWKHPPENRIGLGVREWKCPHCNAHHDRDHNAAKNILRLGHQTLTRSAA